MGLGEATFNWRQVRRNKREIAVDWYCESSHHELTLHQKQQLQWTKECYLTREYFVFTLSHHDAAVILGGLH